MSYKLELPAELSTLHPVFHVSHLTPYRSPTEDSFHADSAVPAIPLRGNRRSWKHDVHTVWTREFKLGQWFYTITTTEHPDTLNRLQVPRSELISGRNVHPRLLAYEREYPLPSAPGVADS